MYHHASIFTGTYCSELHKMVYLNNRRYLPSTSPLIQEKGFYYRVKMQPPPSKRNYSMIKGFHNAVDKASAVYNNSCNIV